MTYLFRYKKFILSFAIILLVFILAVIFIIASQHRAMIKEIKNDAMRELELLGNFTHEALLVKDYASVEQLLKEWAEDHDEIIEIKAVAPNNFVLVNVKKPVTTEKVLDLRHTVMIEDRKLISLEMKRDLTPAQKHMLKLSIPLVIGSILLTVILGVVLWFAMKSLALLPMEREISIREQAERKFRLLLESAPDAMIFVDSNGKIKMVNVQAELLFGYNRNELIGKDIEMLIPERYRSRHREMRHRFSNHPEARPMGMDLELYGLTKKGREFPTDVSLSPIETEAGLFILSAIRDVTERKLAETKIKRNYHFQKAISSILSNSLKSIPLEEQLQGVLDTILSIPGLSLESMGCIYLAEKGSSMLYMAAQKGLPESIVKKCRKVPFTQCLCGQAASTREIIFAKCTDGRHRERIGDECEKPHSHYCVPIIAEERTLGIINLVVKEGHKRKKEEEELLVSVANTIAGILEHNKTDMEKQSLQEQLAESEKLSALGRFTANVAHDIRTPLTLIGGFARRLEKKVVRGEKEKEYLNIIISEVTRLENILKNVLTYSREMPLQAENHDLNDIVRESLKAYQETFKTGSIRVQEKLGKIPDIMIDRDQVLEVINNLLTNAVDSMPSGGTLTVSTQRNLLQDKEYVILNVADTGEGISKDHLKMIFEPFYSTKVIGQGTGLGLSISKKIIEKHGGFISVESEVGRGSTFKIYFPKNGRRVGQQ